MGLGPVTRVRWWRGISPLSTLVTFLERHSRAADRIIAPMLPAAGRLPVGRQWSVEPKWDGVRALVQLQADGQVVVRSRSGRDISDSFEELAGIADAVGRPALLDGELVVIGRDGRPDFEAIHLRMFYGRPPLVAATFMAFDSAGSRQPAATEPSAASAPRTAGRARTGRSSVANLASL